MKWLKSSTQKSWVVSVSGKQAIIPQCETPDNKWLKVGDTEWSEVSASPVIASLIKVGGIIVLDEEPAELRNSIPALQVTNTHLEAENATLKARVLELEAQLRDVTGVDIEAIKDEVRQQCAAEFEQILTQKQSEYDQLKAEAEQALTDRDKTIERLEKKIKKLGGESDGE